MYDLRLDHFMRAYEDFEQAQYCILSGLQQARQAFARNVIYPHLGELVKLHGTLASIVEQLEGVRQSLPKQIEGVDAEDRRVRYKQQELGPDEMATVEELIRWALPHLRETIDEGRTVFEFVEENLLLEEVGIVPSYVEEGYLLVPDPQRAQLHILQYSLSVITRSDERYRRLKTAHVRSLPHRGVFPAPNSIKLQLVAEHRDLPNPATFFFSTDLDFPFEPTMLPVAKRKLMLHLAAAQGGQA
ncbi:MAG: hypothetical protein R3247_09775 [Rhodothermales bacterium]|nr:hypothetical protein [Rhodothermales bacterium]